MLRAKADGNLTGMNVASRLAAVVNHRLASVDSTMAESPAASSMTR